MENLSNENFHLDYIKKCLSFVKYFYLNIFNKKLLVLKIFKVYYTRDLRNSSEY